MYHQNGQKVATLVSEQKNAGYHQVEWDASEFSSGVYYYQIKAGEFHQVRKMIFLK
jgi:flagellar hook assembly protein FlgD